MAKLTARERIERNLQEIYARSTDGKLYALVGELVLLACALDAELDKIAAAFPISGSRLLAASLAPLDTDAKIELLEKHARSITVPNTGLQRPLLSFLGHVDTVDRIRKLACTTREEANWKWQFMPTLTAKLLRRFDFEAVELQATIELGKKALGEAEILIQRFVDAAARRDAEKAKQKNSGVPRPARPGSKRKRPEPASVSARRG